MKKIREAIYFEPEILEWLRERSEPNDRTVSVEVNRILRKVKEQEG
ncbi:hypothetical protein ACFQ5D_23730 [Paenibacillus farraposensis]|uniref:Arc-like DNA binding domain-containing protein n=1 Tax=Paenibacillus farraposensis TaxID=2807095 RepID=A0ABW4DKD1_9BACL|nr:hypothetical protein [Paenibacillus farraposensis]